MQGSWLEGLQSLAGLDGRMAEIGLLPLAGLLFVSLLTSLLMSWVYVLFYGGRGTGRQIHRAFPLIGISITAIFFAVQFSLPLSLGLLGALSIVRFRAPIKEPEEIGFILVIVATSLCVATFSLFFLALVVAAVVGQAALRVGKGSGRQPEGAGVLVVSLPSAEYVAHGDRFLELLSEAFSRDNLESIANRDEQATITYRFAARDRDKAIAVQRNAQEISRFAQTTIHAGELVR